MKIINKIKRITSETHSMIIIRYCIVDVVNVIWHLFSFLTLGLGSVLYFMAFQSLENV